MSRDAVPLAFSMWLIGALSALLLQCGGQRESDRAGLPTPSLRPTAVPTIPPVRFVVLGDAGAGQQGREEVAAAIAEKCSTAHCDFAVLLVDDVHPPGVAGADDSRWESGFEFPYASVPIASRGVRQEDTTGFAYVVVTETSATVEMVDAESGSTAFTTTILREAR